MKRVDTISAKPSIDQHDEHDTQHINSYKRHSWYAITATVAIAILIVANTPPDIQSSPSNIPAAGSLTSSPTTPNNHVPTITMIQARPQPIEQTTPLPAITPGIQLANVETPTPLSVKALNTDKPSQAPSTQSATITSENHQKTPRHKTASTAKTQPKPSPLQPDVTSDELNQLLADFKTFYEEGDLSRITQLFTDDAITNDSANRAEIAKDYQQLFALTTSRNMHMSHFNWTTNLSKAAGTGTFRVLLLTKNANTLQEITGEITITTTKEQQRHKIMALFYHYHVATN